MNKNFQVFTAKRIRKTASSIYYLSRFDKFPTISSTGAFYCKISRDYRDFKTLIFKTNLVCVFFFFPTGNAPVKRDQSA